MLLKADAVGSEWGSRDYLVRRAQRTRTVASMITNDAIRGEIERLALEYEARARLVGKSTSGPGFNSMPS